MNNISICKTEYNNHYLVSSSGPYHIFLSPIVLYFIENEGIVDYENIPLPKQLIIGDHKYNNEEIKYYFNKYLFLKQHGLLAEREKPSIEKISGFYHENQIKWQLANLKQVSFEVTDACNLRCKYCVYGELYKSYDRRDNQFMTFETAQTILDYLINLWKSEINHSKNRDVTFTFYGGEPLLNMRLIKKIIEYVENSVPSSITPQFNMTTNGTLLDKYMDYLVEKNFSLLISLDGNEGNHSYRVTHDGSNSFNKVYKNVQLLKQKHPAFFESKVNINSVLHNRNSVNDICTFIMDEFGKIPTIGELNGSGIDPDKVEEYKLTYKNKLEDLHQSENYEELVSKIELTNPDLYITVTYIQHNSGNFFRKYLDLLPVENNIKYIPTGTCSAFERKMFVTTSGKILPCERIGQQNYLGKIVNGIVDINFENIASKYNRSEE